jgi:hypothetical protein
MAVGIEILERHDVHAVMVEVVASGEHECALPGQRAGDDEQQRGREGERAEHGHVGWKLGGGQERNDACPAPAGASA